MSNTVIYGMDTDASEKLKKSLESNGHKVDYNILSSKPPSIGYADVLFLNMDHRNSLNIVRDSNNVDVKIGLFTTTESFTHGFHQGLFNENVRVVMTSTEFNVAVLKGYELLDNYSGSLRATAIEPRSGGEWQSDYGECCFSMSDGSIIISDDDSPDWIGKNDIEVVVGDEDGNVVAASKVFSSTCRHMRTSKSDKLDDLVILPVL